MAGVPMEFALGVVLSGPEDQYGPNPRAIGHDGYGGSFGMADPEAGLAVAWVMNKMGAVLPATPEGRHPRGGVRLPGLSSGRRVRAPSVWCPEL